MTWNNATSHTLTNDVPRVTGRYPEKLVWGASMIWEGADEEDVSSAAAVREQCVRRERKPAAPRLIHALMGVIFGLGR
jgi:hypothetical protein